MPVPASFARDGFVAPRKKFRGILISTEGHDNTGKSEFLMTAPGPGIVLGIDKNYQSMLDNPEPPPGRAQDDFAWVPITVGLASQSTDPKFYQSYWNSFYSLYRKALDHPDARTVAVDGDSDGWELQTLAEFGKITQIMPIMRTNLYQARRVYISRAFESGKIVIHTNKLKKLYHDVLDTVGNQVMGDDGKVKREWDGKSWERQGFWDHDYLYALQLQHVYTPPTEKRPAQWGVKIVKAKANRGVEGDVLWGNDCNLSTVLEYVYPHIPLSEWGY